MSTLRLPRILALATTLAVPTGIGLSQTTASHQVAVTVPCVLRLRLDDGAAGPQAALDVAVSVAEGRVRIDPNRTRVEVHANTSWALDAHFVPHAGSPGAPLAASLDGDTWHRLLGGARLDCGKATRGWHAVTVLYGLLEAVSDGTFLGTLVFTLAQP